MESQVFTRVQLRASGLGDDQIDRRLASGKLVAVRRGLLAHEAVDHLGQILAARAAHSGRDPVASHRSAARLLALPKPLSGWSCPEFTCSTGPTRKQRDLRISVAALPECDIDRRGQVPRTTPTRTVADCLRILAPRDGLAMVDAALHRHLVTHEQVAAVLARQVRWPGVARARPVLALADARRESPLESWSAWTFEQLGLARPDWQVDLFESGGTFAGRCDCWWQGLAGEADGRSKYRLAAAERGGADAARLFAILEAERAREDRIRRTGAELIRWGASDVLVAAKAGSLIQHIRAELPRATRFHGTAFNGRAKPRQ